MTTPTTAPTSRSTSAPLLARLGSVPVLHYVLAAAVGVVAWVALVDQAASLLPTVLGAALTSLAAALLSAVVALTPLLCLARPWAWTWLALVVLLLAAGAGQLVLSLLVALGGSVLAAAWRSRRAAVAATVATALAVALALLRDGTLALLYDPLGTPMALAGPTLADRLVTLLAWWLGLALLLGVAVLLRSLGARQLAGRRALARTGEVEAQAGVVAERARLAHDLHDVVAHHVSLIAVRAETAPYTHGDLSPAAREVLGEIAADARLALDELRGVLGILSRSETSDRAPQPTWADIPALVERARESGAPVVLEGDASAPVRASVGYAAYRVVQEALTNARKHAPGEPVTVRLEVAEPVVVGVTSRLPEGGSPDVPPGHGLAGMRERVEALGGRLVAGERGADFVVEATLPGAER